MKTITFESNYGNFDYRMTAEVGEDVNAATTALCVQGLANICYRVAGSSVDKALGVKDRKAVEFSDADGERINAAVSKKLGEMLAAEKTQVLAPLKLSFAVTGQHEFGATDGGKPTKDDVELWTSVQSTVVRDAEGNVDKAATNAKFEASLKVLGLDEDYDDAKAIAACRKLRLEAVRKQAEVAKANTKAALGI